MKDGAKKVVVVEDDDEIRELECFVLSDEGFCVTGVAHGDHAVDTVRREEADLVLLDLMLPGKDGNQILAELGEEPATARVPVIVVSAYTPRLARTPQVKQVVPKPFDVSQLVAAVSREAGRQIER